MISAVLHNGRTTSYSRKHVCDSQRQEEHKRNKNNRNTHQVKPSVSVFLASATALRVYQTSVYLHTVCPVERVQNNHFEMALRLTLNNVTDLKIISTNPPQIHLNHSCLFAYLFIQVVHHQPCPFMCLSHDVSKVKSSATNWWLPLDLTPNIESRQVCAVRTKMSTRLWKMKYLIAFYRNSKKLLHKSWCSHSSSGVQSLLVFYVFEFFFFLPNFVSVSTRTVRWNQCTLENSNVISSNYNTELFLPSREGCQLTFIWQLK